MSRIRARGESIYAPKDDTSKLGNFRASYPLNPDLITNYEIRATKDKALKLAVENSIGSGLVNSMVDGTVGDELSLETNVPSNILTTNKEKISRNSQTIEEYWNLWSRTPVACDMDQKHTLGMMVRTAAFNAYATGDVLQFIGIRDWNGIYMPVVRFYDGRSVANKDLMENTQQCVSGVYLDSSGRVTGYNIRTEKSRFQFDNKKVEAWAKYPGSSLERLQYNLITTGRVQPNQKRGRPLLLPVMNDLVMMEKYNGAELVKAVIQSYITAFVERDIGLLNHGLGETGDDPLLGTLEGDAPQSETGSYEAPFTMGPGYINTMAPGEKIVLTESKSPVADFWKFLEGNLKLVSMGVGLPFEVALQVFNSNYSASQAAIQAAARKWDIERQLFAWQTMQPVYELFVHLMVMQGVVNCPGYMDKPFVRAAWNNAKWHGPVILNIDPVKNATAATLRLNNHTSTYEDECRNLGKDFDRVADRRSQEEEVLRALGLKPNLTVDKKNVEEGEEE